MTNDDDTTIHGSLTNSLNALFKGNAAADAPSEITIPSVKKYSKNQGTKRLKFPYNRELIDWIYLYLFDEYPDVFIERHIVEAVVLGMIDYVKQGLEKGEETRIIGLGKFRINRKLNQAGKEQIYPKFKFSRNLVLGLRQVAGTLTEAEAKEITSKIEFIQTMWDKKKARIDRTAQRREQQKLERAAANKNKARKVIPTED